MTKLKKTYPILPLRNTVLFPNQIIPIYIGREQSLKLISDVSECEDKTIIVVAQKDGNEENPEPSDLYESAVLGKVMKVFDMPDKSKSAIDFLGSKFICVKFSFQHRSCQSSTFNYLRVNPLCFRLASGNINTKLGS